MSALPNRADGHRVARRASAWALDARTSHRLPRRAGGLASASRPSWQSALAAAAVAVVRVELSSARASARDARRWAAARLAAVRSVRATRWRGWPRGDSCFSCPPRARPTRARSRAAARLGAVPRVEAATGVRRLPRGRHRRRTARSGTRATELHPPRAGRRRPDPRARHWRGPPPSPRARTDASRPSHAPRPARGASTPLQIAQPLGWEPRTPSTAQRPRRRPARRGQGRRCRTAVIAKPGPLHAGRGRCRWQSTRGVGARLLARVEGLERRRRSGCCARTSASTARATRTASWATRSRMASRILHAADAFEAMTLVRPPPAAARPGRGDGRDCGASAARSSTPRSIEGLEGYVAESCAPRTGRTSRRPPAARGGSVGPAAYRGGVSPTVPTPASRSRPATSATSARLRAELGVQRRAGPGPGAPRTGRPGGRAAFLAADETHPPERVRRDRARRRTILRHARAGERIVVHGDYDVDGVCCDRRPRPLPAPPRAPTALVPPQPRRRRLRPLRATVERLAAPARRCSSPWTAGSPRSTRSRRPARRASTSSSPTTTGPAPTSGCPTRRSCIPRSAATRAPSCAARPSPGSSPLRWRPRPRRAGPRRTSTSSRWPRSPTASRCAARTAGSCAAGSARWPPRPSPACAR